MPLYKSNRQDGRSDIDLLRDLIVEPIPGVVYPFEAISEALSYGLAQPVTKNRMYSAIAQFNRVLLPETKRILRSIRGVGYAVAYASDHAELSTARRRKAERQLEKGYQTIMHVRTAELTPAERSLRDGMLTMMSGIYRMVKNGEARHDRTEALIDQLRQRVDRLEDRKGE